MIYLHVEVDVFAMHFQEHRRPRCEEEPPQHEFDCEDQETRSGPCPVFWGKDYRLSRVFTVVPSILPFLIII